MIPWFGAYNTGDILWLGDWSVGWIVVLAAMGVAVIALSAYDLRPLPPRRRWTLVALRAGVYALAVGLLLEPAVDLKNISKVKNHVAVLVDASRSMELASDDPQVTRMERAQAILPGFVPLVEKLSEDHTFTFFTYGEELKGSSVERAQLASPTEDGSDLSAALDEVRERLEGQDIGGLVVVTDGIDTGAMGRRTRRGEELDQGTAGKLGSLGVPVNTLAVARAEGLRDVAIAKHAR
ncbi:MAG: hypothetical protein AAGI01_15505, partial [Myxococcota bacterium]